MESAKKRIVASQFQKTKQTIEIKNLKDALRNCILENEELKRRLVEAGQDADTDARVSPHVFQHSALDAPLQTVHAKMVVEPDDDQLHQPLQPLARESSKESADEVLTSDMGSMEASSDPSVEPREGAEQPQPQRRKQPAALLAKILALANHGTEAQLKTLKWLGPARASAIICCRNGKRNRYGSQADLEAVLGPIASRVCSDNPDPIPIPVDADEA
ncbi:hypothetical protein BC831DRAFT_476562 [Entophlyctis helioformis]|nr:hypothetical protein BC831DRAFT_476562 [Entophlyctis helioformis]